MSAKLTAYQESLKKIQDYNVSKLERKELGILGFSDAIEPAARIVDLANSLYIDKLNDLPLKVQKTIQNACTAVDGKFTQIINFDFKTTPNPGQYRDQLVTELSNQYNEFFNASQPFISYSLLKQKDLNGIQQKVQSILNEAQTKIGFLEGKLQEANSLIEGIKNASAKGGTLEQAQHFREEKVYHKRRARWWSTATIVSALILIAYTFSSIKLHEWFHIDLSGDGKNSLAWQVQTTKLFGFTVLAYILMLSTKNFMSHKHNMVVNSHREVALHTFEALAKASNQDGSARDIILSHAASCIFSPQETGYIKPSPLDGAGSLGNASLVLNLAKRAAGKEG